MATKEELYQWALDQGDTPAEAAELAEQGELFKWALEEGFSISQAAKLAGVQAIDPFTPASGGGYLGDAGVTGEIDPDLVRKLQEQDRGRGGGMDPTRSTEPAPGFDMPETGQGLLEAAAGPMAPMSDVPRDRMDEASGTLPTVGGLLSTAPDALRGAAPVDAPENNNFTVNPREPGVSRGYQVGQDLAGLPAKFGDAASQFGAAVKEHLSPANAAPTIAQWEAEMAARNQPEVLRGIQGESAKPITGVDPLQEGLAARDTLYGSGSTGSLLSGTMEGDDLFSIPGEAAAAGSDPFRPKARPDLNPEINSAPVVELLTAPVPKPNPMNRPNKGLAEDAEDAEGELNWLQRLAKDKLGLDEGGRADLARALMQGGFATMAGTSPHAMVNIGKGGSVGVDAFYDSKEGREESERQKMLDDMAMEDRDYTRARQAEADARARQKHQWSIADRERALKNAGKKLTPAQEYQSTVAELVAGGMDPQAAEMAAYVVLGHKQPEAGF